MNYLSLIRKKSPYIGYGFIHYFFSSLGQSFLISLFTLPFAEAVGINAVSFGSIYSVATIGSALVLPIVGKYLDTVKLRYFSLVVAILLILSCLLASLVNHVIVLFVALMSLRFCGQGLLPLTAATAIARYFDKTRGKALSLIGIGVSMGEVLFPILVIAMIATFGWRITWIYLAGFFALVFIPSVIFLIPLNDRFQTASTPRDQTQKRGNSLDANRSQVLKDPHFYMLSIVYTFLPLFSTGIIIHHHFLIQHYNWSAELLAVCISTFGLFRLGTSLLAGPIVDRFSASRVFSYHLMPMLLGISALLIYPNEWTIILFFMSMGASASLSSLTTTAMWAEIYGTTYLGSIRSMVSMIMVFSTALGLFFFGWALEDKDWLDTVWISSLLFIGG